MSYLLRTVSKLRRCQHHTKPHLFCPSFYKVGAKCCRQYNELSGGDRIRIGCASGFWGDTAVSAPQLIHTGRIQYLVFDYLAEITMSILAAGRRKNPELGYAPDFVHVAIGPHLGAIKKQGIRVISNAGGVNPYACAQALKEVAKKADVDLRVAVVTGDDVMPQLKELKMMNLTDLDTGRSLPDSLVTMNAYFGSAPIVSALDKGADVVITGRCVDSAVVLAPLIHSFKWDISDYDRLAMGSLAGHLVECGAQATGGIFTDWHLVEGWDNIGFPIVECTKEGPFVLTKPPKTGGLVSIATVGEQLLYEIGDPQAYMLPDVTCDFSQVNLKQVQDPETKDVGVLVTGATGRAPSNDYKVSATFLEGYRSTVVFTVFGPDAAAKGQKTADAILKRHTPGETHISLRLFFRKILEKLPGLRVEKHSLPS